MVLDPRDKSGYLTLKRMNQANRFNTWIYETIKPYLHGRIMEIGSGIGNISRFLLEDGFQTWLSDLDPYYCNSLKSLFHHHENLLGITRMDIESRRLHQEHGKLLSTVDTLFSLNVLEHVKNHELAMDNFRSLLKKKGKLITLVPAHPWLYNRLDEGLSHHRRYSAKQLKTIFEKHGFTPVHMQHLNLFGILGWFLSGKVMGLETISQDLLLLYNHLVPAARVLDRVNPCKAGLSLICVGIKR